MIVLNAFLFWLAVVTLVVVFSGGLMVVLGFRKIGQLSDSAAEAGPVPCSVSLIVAARNEEQKICPALESFCGQEYQPLEIIAINDRSTDQTGAILDSVAAQHALLRVIHVEELPESWLGKNHALQIGAEASSGELLLFTDADVVMQPTVIQRAVRHLSERDADHLAILPRIKMPNWFLECFAITFAVYFSSYFRPWSVQNPRSRSYVGVGAFNMIRARVYQAIGTYRAIAMRPDDDVKLGKLVKKHGFRQEMLFAGRLMYVPWYGSVRETIVGLEKNVFSGVDYRVSIIIVSSLVALTMNVWPFAALLVTRGATWWLNLAIVAGLLLMCWTAARHALFRPWCSIAFPATALMFVFIQWRATILTLWNRGIRWRDTHYPLAELKANRVPW